MHLIHNMINILIITSILILSARSVIGRGMPIKIITLNATISAVLIALTSHCISTENAIPIDAICLFYIVSHCVPIVYTILLKKRNDRKTKPF